MKKILWFFICLVISACGASRPGTIRDLEVLPQDAACYLNDLQEPFISPERQAVLYADFRRRFFGPWHRQVPRFGAGEVFSGFRRYGSRRIYGETNLPLPPDWIEAMAREADVSGYPSRRLPAVAVVHAAMRTFPTEKPVFLDPSSPGRGFPFDMLQNSLVPAGTPLLITHVSRSGEWALVETDWAAGWVRWPQIALADPGFISASEEKPLAGFWADKSPVVSRDGRFLVSGRVGMALGLVDDPGSGDHCTVCVPVRDHLGRARLQEALVDRRNVCRLPFPATRKNAVRLLNALMGQNYGWGGLYENRDCSALIQDTLAPFGLFLPRNSKEQAAAGRFVSFEGMDGPQKERCIRQQGVALLTILYMPGHVMLYLGQDPACKRAVACHAMWGLKTLGPFPEGPGRWVVGRTVITSLEAGRERSDLAPGGLLLDKLAGMVRLD